MTQVLKIEDRIKVHELAREMIAKLENWTSTAFATGSYYRLHPHEVTLGGDDNPFSFRPKRMSVVAAELRALCELHFIGYTPQWETPMLNEQLADIMSCLGVACLYSWNTWGHKIVLAGLDATIASLKYRAAVDPFIAEHGFEKRAA